MAVKTKTAARSRRHTRLRKKVVGTELRPRLVVTRSARHVFVQVVDDSNGVVMGNELKATVARGAMGAMYMEIEGSRKSPRVKRVK